MATRDEVIAAVNEHRVIVIARGFETEELLRAAEAMYEGGIRLMEVTYDAKGNPPDEEIAGRIGALARHFDGRMYIGAGTVLTAKQVELTHRAGGRFIISPDSNEEVIRKTRELGLVSVPGAFTATEATTASRYGADFIKIFPNSEVKPSYIKALTVPLSHIRFLAVGGVTSENAAEYLAAGAVGIGVASGILDKKQVRAGDYAGITEKARRYVSAVKG